MRSQASLGNLATAGQLLRAAAIRRRSEIQSEELSKEEIHHIETELSEIDHLSQMIEQGRGLATSDWTAEYTCIVARKAKAVARDSDWMAVRHGL